jgi:hypothetical protein
MIKFYNTIPIGTLIIFIRNNHFDISYIYYDIISIRNVLLLEVRHKILRLYHKLHHCHRDILNNKVNGTGPFFCHCHHTWP